MKIDDKRKLTNKEMITTAIETKVTTTIGTLEFNDLKLFKISPKIPTLTFTKDF